MNSPRFLVASDPDGEHFANSIVAVQTQAPLRVLHVDLDNVYDPDPAQQARNLDQLVQRVVDMGAGTVFLQAFADPKGDGLVHSLYFPNRHLPVRADLFNRVAWQLRTRAHASVYAWMPVLSFALDPKLPRVTLGPGNRQGRPRPGSIPAPVAVRSASAQIIGEIYEDLARNNAIDGVLYHDDALLSDFEDASPAALKAYAARPARQHIAACAPIRR
jgi:biofilm PGA synthesis lipoprotein PgaB